MSSPSARGSLATTEPRHIRRNGNAPDGSDDYQLRMEYDDDGLAGEIVYEHPMTVGSRGRLWTTESLRRQLGITSDSYGYGSRLLVRLAVHDREPSWGSAVESAIFPTTLGVDGVIRPPKSVRERLSLSEGDHVRVTLYRPRGETDDA